MLKGIFSGPYQLTFFLIKLYTSCLFSIKNFCYFSFLHNTYLGGILELLQKDDSNGYIFFVEEKKKIKMIPGYCLFNKELWIISSSFTPHHLGTPSFIYQELYGYFFVPFPTTSSSTTFTNDVGFITPFINTLFLSFPKIYFFPKCVPLILVSNVLKNVLT